MLPNANKLSALTRKPKKMSPIPPLEQERPSLGWDVFAKAFRVRSPIGAICCHAQSARSKLSRRSAQIATTSSRGREAWQLLWACVCLRPEVSGSRLSSVKPTRVRYSLLDHERKNSDRCQRYWNLMKHFSKKLWWSDRTLIDILPCDFEMYAIQGSLVSLPILVIGKTRLYCSSLFSDGLFDPRQCETGLVPWIVYCAGLFSWAVVVRQKDYSFISGKRSRYRLLPSVLLCFRQLSSRAMSDIRKCRCGLSAVLHDIKKRLLWMFLDQMHVRFTERSIIKSRKSKTN